MRNNIRRAIKNSTRLQHVQEAIIEVFIDTNKNNPSKKIGYVAGIISSDGDEHVLKNQKRLEQIAEKLKKKTGFPVFSSVDLFGDGKYDQIDDYHVKRPLREKGFIQFWESLLKSGHITDIYMTPRWKESKGAKAEHAVAKQNGLTIHYIDEELNEILSK